MNPAPFRFAEKVPGLRAFTTLRGHNLGLNTQSPPAEVVASRRQAWAGLGLRLEDSVFMQQVHSDRIAEVGAAERGRGALALSDAIPETDILITRQRGVLLCVGHADCLAVLLADTRRGVVGAAHMGWRGAALKVASKLLTAMGSDPADVLGGLGPCLGPDHLELSEKEHPLFQGLSCASPLEQGHFKLDLWEAALSQLEACGLSRLQVEVQRDCSGCQPDRYYSYRRESGKTGRMMSCIGLMD